MNNSAPQALEELEGDFALVLVDRKRRHLYAMRDPMGAYPLYWRSLPGRVMVSTGMEPLLDQLSSRAINLEYIADYLLVVGSQSELPSEHCVYQGIRRLLPGSILTWNSTENQVRTRSYWNWLHRLIHPDNDDINQAGEAIQEVLRGAVNERLNGRVAAHLSRRYGFHCGGNVGGNVRTQDRTATHHFPRVQETGITK